MSAEDTKTIEKEFDIVMLQIIKLSEEFKHSQSATINTEIKMGLEKIKLRLGMLNATSDGKQITIKSFKGMCSNTVEAAENLHSALENGQVLVYEKQIRDMINAVVISLLKLSPNIQNMGHFSDIIKVLTVCEKIYCGSFAKFANFTIPLITWQSYPNCITFPGKFELPENSLNGFTEFLITKELHLIHCTTVDNFLGILDTEDKSLVFDSQKFQNNFTKFQNKRDICSQGLNYFGVDLDLAEIKIQNEYAKENRYGVVKIRFCLQDIEKPEESFWQFYKLGSKVYGQEYSQHVLATYSNLKADQWHVFDGILHEIERIEGDSLLMAKFENDPFGKWTHPEIIIPGKIKVPLSKISVRFDSIHNKNCFHFGGVGNKCGDCVNFELDMVKCSFEDYIISSFAEKIKKSANVKKFFESFQKSSKVFDDIQLESVFNKCSVQDDEISPKN